MTTIVIDPSGLRDTARLLQQALGECGVLASRLQNGSVPYAPPDVEARVRNAVGNAALVLRRGTETLDTEQRQLVRSAAIIELLSPYSPRLTRPRKPTPFRWNGHVFTSLSAFVRLLEHEGQSLASFIRKHPGSLKALLALAGAPAGALTAMPGNRSWLNAAGRDASHWAGMLVGLGSPRNVDQVNGFLWHHAVPTSIDWVSTVFETTSFGRKAVPAGAKQFGKRVGLVGSAIGILVDAAEYPIDKKAGLVENIFRSAGYGIGKNAIPIAAGIGIGLAFTGAPVAVVVGLGVAVGYETDHIHIGSKSLNEWGGQAGAWVGREAEKVVSTDAHALLTGAKAVGHAEHAVVSGVESGVKKAWHHFF